jgi:hypothetical protein
LLAFFLDLLDAELVVFPLVAHFPDVGVDFLGAARNEPACLLFRANASENGKDVFAPLRRLRRVDDNFDRPGG